MLNSVRPKGISDYRNEIIKIPGASYTSRQVSTDSTAFNKVPFLYSQRGNVINVVTFTRLENPLKLTQAIEPALQMKVRGVTRFQPDINAIAKTAWKDGQKMIFQLDGASKADSLVAKRVSLACYNEETKKFVKVGRVHHEIAEVILPFLEKHPEDFTFELSNIIAGTTQSAPTTGLRVNLIYKGQDREAVTRAFNQILNDPRCSNKVLLYQPPSSPEEVLKHILSYEEATNGAGVKQAMEAAIANIGQEIKQAQRILLVGHSKPDGDTIGCTVGLKNAIDTLFTDKEVEIAIDDKMPGLFRHNLPGIEEIKRPNNPEFVANTKKLITELKAKEQTEDTAFKLEVLEKELQEAEDSHKHLDPNKKYDLVILMDIATPSRFSGHFKDFIRDAKKVVVIDHHPTRYGEWQQSKQKLGVDFKDMQSANRTFIAPAVGACTQLVAVLVDGLSNGYKAFSTPLIQNKYQEKIQRFVAGLITGMSTDTGSYTRGANLLPEHMRIPVQQRPNFLPEGMAKWLMKLTQGAIDKKWLRDNITYELSPEAHALMLSHCETGTVVHENLSLGMIQADYDQMKSVWKQARKINTYGVGDPETTLLDVYNEFKYSEPMSVFRSNPSNIAANNKSEEKVGMDYQGAFDTDRIAVLIGQDRKAGELDDKSEIAKMNGLRISIRSQEGTEHAELICSLFGGGGHGSASGGRVDLPGVNLDTKLGVKINGELVDDSSVIYERLKQNYVISHNSHLSEDDKIARCHKIELIEEANGKTCADLITAMTCQIRDVEEGTLAAPVKLEKPVGKDHVDLSDGSFARQLRLTDPGAYDKLRKMAAGEVDHNGRSHKGHKKHRR